VQHPGVGAAQAGWLRSTGRRKGEAAYVYKIIRQIAHERVVSGSNIIKINIKVTVTGKIPGTAVPGSTFGPASNVNRP
jgi:hypothetical protein